MNNQNALIIQRVPDEDKENILFVRSCMPVLHDFSAMMLAGIPDNIGYSKYHNLHMTLLKIMNFLFGVEGNKTIFYEDYREDPITFRQKLLKDYRLMECLTDLIFLCKHHISKSEISANEVFWLDKISTSSYHTLRYSIKEYRPNELYCFQWIDFILEQIVQPQALNKTLSMCSRAKMSDNEAAGRLFTELVDNNEKILDTKINAETIKNIVRFLIELDANKKYIKILRAFCICNSKAVFRNQLLLTSHILLNNKHSGYFLFKIEMEEEELFVSNEILGLNRVLLKKLPHLSQTRDNRKIFHYFVEVIHFIADLCFEGNSNAIKFLERHYDFEIILDILNHEEIDYEIKNAFCHLFTNLWVDLSEYSRLKVDIKIVDWDQLKDIYSFPLLDLDDIFKFKPIKYYISQTIAYQFDSIDLTKRSAISQLSFLSTIVTLARKMMELGLYTEIKEINSLIKGLKQVLVNSFNFMDSPAETNLSRVKRIRSDAFGQQENTSYDINIAVSKLRECRGQICGFFEFIGRVQVMLKQYTMIFRIKNLIQTSYGESFNPSREPYIEKKGTKNILYHGFPIEEKDLLTKIGFLMNSCIKEDGFIKICHEKEDIKDFLSVLISMSFESNLSIKKSAFNIMISLFSYCRSLTESITSIIGIERSMKEYHDRVISLKLDLNKLLSQFKTSTEFSMGHLLNNIREILEKLVYHSVERESMSQTKGGGLQEPESENIMGNMRLDAYETLLLQRSESRISRMKQDILRGTGTLETLVSFLALSVKMKYKGDDKLDETVQGALFKFVSLVLFDNEDNQFFVLKKIELFWELFFGQKTSLESLLFLYSLIKDHKRLLFDETICADLIRVIGIKENSLGREKGPKRVVLVNILGAFCDYRGHPIERNQIMIIKNFIEEGYNFLAKKLNEVRFKTQFAEFSNNLDSEPFISDGPRMVPLPIEVKIILSIISLLNRCNEGGNTYVLNISQKTITLE